MTSTSDVSHRNGYDYKPVNREALHSKPDTPINEEPDVETTSLRPVRSIPLMNLDVERDGARGPQAKLTRYGSMLSDSSSYVETEHKPARFSTGWTNDEGARPTRYRYWSYYLPSLTWIPAYQRQWLRGDAVAALTVASLYIPMCFSFAILGKVDPISGLYAFIIHPLIYALLGSCPQMVVGPEATGSLMVGAIINQISVNAETADQTYDAAHISGVATAIAGAMLLIAGLGRIGFVDGVLNRPFMQGFISGVGFVLIVEQAVPELGLLDLARENGVAHDSAATKLWFLLTHLRHAHTLTAAVAFSSLTFIVICR